jgi:hypothetical protein
LAESQRGGQDIILIAQTDMLKSHASKLQCSVVACSLCVRVTTLQLGTLSLQAVERWF